MFSVRFSVGVLSDRLSLSLLVFAGDDVSTLVLIVNLSLSLGAGVFSVDLSLCLGAGVVVFKLVFVLYEFVFELYELSFSNFMNFSFQTFLSWGTL